MAPMKRGRSGYRRLIKNGQKINGGQRGGARAGAGRPKGRLNDRTLLLRAGLDEWISDRWFFDRVRKAIQAGGPGSVQMLIQVGKWKGLTDPRQEIEYSGLDALAPKDQIIQVLLFDGQEIPPPKTS